MSIINQNSINFDMHVTKRNGELEDISFDKILIRIKKLGQEANITINWSSLSMKVIDQLYDNISTTKIDELAAEQCASLSTLNPDYSTLAGRIVVSNHHKNTDAEFFTVAEQLYNFKDIHGNNWPLVSDKLWEFTQKYRDEINDTIVHDRDHLIDYFGFKTLERAYLFKIGKKVVERVQHMWMRVSIGIHGDICNPDSLRLVKETYDLMSQKYFTHATPTLFNAGTPRPQLSSCYLIAMEDDSIDGIYNTLKDCALISKYSGGIGLHIHNIRAKDSHIKGTNGKTDGLVPMLRVFNTTARYVNQCFTPDSWVYSKNGPKQFKDIVINDELVTVDGTFKKVNEVIVSQVSKEIMEIRVINSLFPIKVTKEHQLYLIKSGTIEPDYYSASSLDLNDLVGFPIPTFEEDNYIDDLEYYKFYGMILINGTIDSKESGVKIPNINNKQIQFVYEYLNKCKVLFCLGGTLNYITLKWDNDENHKINISREMLYANESLEDKNENGNEKGNEKENEKGKNEEQCKQIWNAFLHLPKEKIHGIIDGIMFASMQANQFVALNEILCDSLQLTMQLRYLFLRTGVLTSGYKTYSNNNNNDNKYILIISEKVKSDILIERRYPNNVQDEYFECNGVLWSRIDSIGYTEYNGDVYDFNMTDNHNYLTDMGLVHNSGKRNGSFAIYLEPWHSDIYDFLDLKKNHGDEEQRARDLFYALWIPDLFMERVKEPNGKWSLFCPDECPGLSDVYGSEFVELYTKYESSGKARRTVQARELWLAVLDSQMETGTPYLLYKDAVNKKSNQKNLGTIKSSNLCTEITEFSDDKETAVCNLASIGLPSFVKDSFNTVTGVPVKVFDYEKLHQVTKVITNNLNRVIDINFYPTEKTRVSNMKHRPIGIGVQGLADTFILLDIPFNSDVALMVNRLIFETIYHAALEQSNEQAISRLKAFSAELKVSTTDTLFTDDEIRLLDEPRRGAYSSFIGSPASKGELQYDMWNVKPTPGRYDWDKLKESIIKHGLRNSLLVAPMPTASTSQILGFNECFEPITSNIYSRGTLAGEFIIVNKYLLRELIDLGVWNEQIKNNIIANKGSIQQLTSLPEHIRNKYKIVWEIPMKQLIDMSAERGAFICQSQSLNLWMEDPVYNKLTSMHFYAWNRGLKTGMYYLRRKAKHQAQQFTIEPTKQSNNKNEEKEDEICDMCSA